MSKILWVSLFRHGAPKDSMKKSSFLLFLFLFSICSRAFCFDESANVSKGIWVSVFSERKVLFSKEAIKELVNFAQKNSINEIYLQLYQSGRSFYDTKFNDRTKYEEMLKLVGADPVDILLKEASLKNIKVFAWINVLSIGQNKSAPIVKKFGDSVLTRDQYLKTSGGARDGQLDKYYIKDEHFFLEPGDPRVGDYTLLIVNEIMDR